MTQEQISAEIRDLVDYGGVRLKDIEEELGIPKNSLSGMINGSRNFVKKWQKKVILYLEDRKKMGLEKQAPEPLAPKEVAVTVSPPPGLTKIQMIRWHRENSQTLQ